MAEIEECPTDKSNEKEIIKKLLDYEELKIGEIWYVICRKWFKSWKEYVEFDFTFHISRNVSRPGAISNNNLMIVTQNGFVLRETLICEHDYTVLSAPVWKRLQKWFVYCFLVHFSFEFFRYHFQIFFFSNYFLFSNKL